MDALEELAGVSICKRIKSRNPKLRLTKHLDGMPLDTPQANMVRKTQCAPQIICGAHCVLFYICTSDVQMSELEDHI